MGHRILLLGAGGREHALAWKISSSPHCDQLWVAPGNPGTALVAENIPLSWQEEDALVAFVQENKVDLVVIGPEDPLASGLSDRFHREGIACFGPSASAAELESSKAFCKDVLVRHRIPTADYRVFSEFSSASSYFERLERFPLVVKASGLAAGKGVFICEDATEATEVAHSMLEGHQLGEAGSQIVVEEFLDGPEASAFALTDGRTLLPLESCMDHKQLLDGGRGPNTGGMGAVSPNPLVSDRMRDSIERQVLLPAVHGMNHEGRPFRGILFAGLKLTPAGPKVLEFNVRFGDPECQILMMRLQADLVPYLLACATTTLEELEAPAWDPRPAVTVILASRGYPGKYETGFPILGLDALETGSDLQVFHAGTALNEAGDLVTAGGRVLAVTALGETMAEARERAYVAADEISFEGAQRRTDIGAVASAAALEQTT